jgi:DNA-binding NarL/FixJ family response regulator
VAVVEAREACARGDWRAAYDVLSPARDQLEPADLEVLALAAWWLGDSPASMAVSEALYQRLVAEGAHRQAAERAMRLALEWFTRGDLQLGNAWLSRAARVLDGLPRSAAHGYLAYLSASLEQMQSPDAETAEAAALELDGFAAEHDDPALAGFALTLHGLAAVIGGRTSAGFADLDEAMLPLVAGGVDALWTGDFFCTVIHLCDELGDLARMRAWTSAMAQWSAPRPSTFMYAGVTRIHELQLLVADGDWERVERELGERSASLVGAHGWLAGEGYYTLGEVRRLRGDAAGARAAYEQARGLGHDAQPGGALLLRAEGRPAEGLAALRVALADGDPLLRARLLPAGVDLALDVQDRAAAGTMADELEATASHFGSPGLLARAAEARAALLLDAGDPGAAIPLLERAAGVYRAQRHRHASALVHERLAAAREARGEHEAARAERATALAIHGQLGATPDVARLSPPAVPGGLTGREAEVLALVRGGASNREVARALTISEKTVSRHLANIFAKLGVGSRTAAAAWAHEHHL